MSTFFQWWVLSAITGRPILSLVLIVAFWFAVDRFTLGVLPDPLKFITRWRRQWHWERILKVNPHDRQARYQLSETLLDRKQYAQAMHTLKPNIEAGEDDKNTVFVMASACLGAGHHEQGEKLLVHIEEIDPGFRLGEIERVRGLWRLKRGDAVGAKRAFESLVMVRKGSVEAKVLLAQALTATGEDGTAALLKDQAWDEFVSAPRFVRRKERLWAWRARPSRPLIYAVVLIAVLLFLGAFLLPALGGSPYMPDGSMDE
jgi:tetratricopeptide (TPR) repeat protein